MSDDGVPRPRRESASTGVPRAWMGARIVELDECGSTNDEAARLARAGAQHGTIVVAHTQTAGRGREGRAWASPRAGLYLSAIVRPPLALAQVPPLTLAIGVGACDAVRLAGAPAALKWPNDLLVGRRKLGGVLVEAHSQGARLDAVVVGIGINLEPLPPSELTVSAISLAEACAPAPAPARADFIASLLGQLETWLDRYVAGGLAAVIPAWHERMAPDLLTRATVDGVPLTGTAAGLDHDGALLVRDADGALHRVRSGDVQLA